jgi:nitrite reductase/ring-hydroxylating ferredoxin subunit
MLGSLVNPDTSRPGPPLARGASEPNELDSLPAAWYCEGDPFQHERRTIFGREWLLLARTEQLREPGAFVTANLGGWPVFALADGSGSINAFRNVCRHQQMQVLEKPRGRCEVLRCRYHGWTYDLSGCFVTAPELVAPADAHSAANHLGRIACATLGPLLFVNLDSDASPLARALGAAAPTLDRRLARCAPAGETMTDYSCNWKTFVEHCLAARAFGATSDGAQWLWQWPLAMAHVAPHAVCVQQIVPRTFARTRVVDHVFVEDVALAPAALDEARLRAAADKAACEALQREREAAGGPRPAALADFHRRVRAAHAAVDAAVAQHGG